MALTRIKTSNISPGAINSNALAEGVGGGTSYDSGANSTGFFGLPVGTTAERPASPAVGMIRYNTSVGSIEIYNSTGWETLGGFIGISTVSPTSFSGAANTLFTITGTGFSSGDTVKFVTSGGTEYSADVTTIVSPTEITARTPQDFTVDDEPLSVKVVSLGGKSATKTGAVDCGSVPAFNASAGSIGNIYNSSRSTLSHLNAKAVDPDGSTVSHTVLSGTIPTGITLQTNGTFTGTADAVGSDTTYTFTVRATDSIGNANDREFSVTVKAPVTETITTTGNTSWDVPAGVATISNVIMLGGGGGGTASFQAYGMGGGGAGYVNVNNVSVIAGSTYALVVGAGGLGAIGASGVTLAGEDGGDTTAFGNIAEGGQGGQPAYSGAGGSFTITAGTDNGSANGGTPTSSGNNGKPGGNNGGGATYGTGPAATGNYSPGTSASGYGNGAGGGSSSQNWIGTRSGSGSSGLIILTY